MQRLAATYIILWLLCECNCTVKSVRKNSEFVIPFIHIGKIPNCLYSSEVQVQMKQKLFHLLCKSHLT